MISKLDSVVPRGIDKMDAAIYIDRSYPFLGKARVKNLIKNRQLKINGTRAGEGALVSGGDELSLYAEGGYDFSLHILYESDGIIAFDKTRGLPTDRDEDGIGEDTALERLRRVYPGAMLVHRLDAGTAGVMIAATDEGSAEEIKRLFSEHFIEKKYSCTVVGAMPKPRDKLVAYLKKDAKSSMVFVSDSRESGALEIETIYELKREFTQNGVKLSELSVMIPTGRTHQIRAHLSHIGHPLLGDDKYGDRRINKLLNAKETDLKSEEIHIKDAPRAGKYAGLRFRTEL